MTNRALIVVFATALNLVIAEGILQWMYPAPVYAIKYSPWGWEHIPNLTFRHVPDSRESQTSVTYSASGLRSAVDPSEVTPEGVLRIALLGDSETEGAVVEHRHTSSEVLERALSQTLGTGNVSSYLRAEVLNAGVYSYEPCQMLRLFLERVKNFQPQLVYVIHNGKFSDNVFCNQKIGQLEFTDFSYTTIEYYFRWIVGYIRAKSQLANYLVRGIGRLTDNATNNLQQLPARLFHYETQEIKLVEATPALESISWRKYTKTDSIGLKETQTERESLTRLVYTALQEAVSEYGGVMRVIFLSKSNNPRLENILYSAGIPFFDLEKMIEDNGQHLDRFPGNLHLNKRGHHTVGWSLAGIVTEIDLQQ